MSEAKTIDLNALVGVDNRQVEITVKPDEHADDRVARLQKERWSFWVTQIWLAVAMTVLAIAAVYLTTLVNADDAVLSQWARTGLTTILTGVIAFFTGLKVGGK